MGSRTALERHQTLRASIDWSYKTLIELEKSLLLQLSVFSGGFDLEAVTGVCLHEQITTNQLENWQILNLLSRLVDKSLVFKKEENGNKSRYHLLETVRQYAKDILIDSDQFVKVQMRHLEYYAIFAQTAAPFLEGIEQTNWLQTVDLESDNLRIALESQGIEKLNTDLEMRLTTALSRYWYVRGHLSEGRVYLERALQRPSTKNFNVARVKCLQAAGDLAFRQADYVTAINFYEESITISTTLQDHIGIADGLYGIGYSALRQGEYSRGRAYCEQSLASLRNEYHEKKIARTLTTLGIITRAMQEFSTSRKYLNEGLDLFQKLKDLHGCALAIYNLAVLNLWEEKYDDARILLDNSIELRMKIGDQQGLADSLVQKGEMESAQGNFAAAYEYYSKSLAIQRKIADQGGAGWTLLKMGDVKIQTEDLESAEALSKESYLLHSKTGEKSGCSWSLKNLSIIAYRQRKYLNARQLEEENLALLCILRNNRNITNSLEFLKKLDAIIGPSKRAQKLREIAATMINRDESTLTSSVELDTDNQITLLHDVFGDSMYSVAWAEGRLKTIEEILDTQE